MIYKDAGVDIEKAANFIEDNLAAFRTTHDNKVLTNRNNFAGLYDLSRNKYKQPVLAVSCDGVGSKLKLASQYQQYFNIGIDVVSNNVNDILCSGATPLMLLDYYAVGSLDLEISNEIMQGIVDGCLFSNIALIGGETAELPLTYRKSDFDLVGTCIGIVEKEEILVPENIVAGDILIGIKSSGPHSNGYSLINKIIDNTTDYSIIEELLEPTKNYSRIFAELKKYIDIKGAANITGGGIVDNLPRILPDDLAAYIDFNAYQRPEIFNWIANTGNIPEDEMRKVFNLGIGMIICVDDDDVDYTMDILGEDGIALGFVMKKINSDSVVFNSYY